MNALAKLDGAMPWVSESLRRDLLDVRAVLVRLMGEVQTLSHEVIDSNRPMFKSIELPQAVEPMPGFPLSPDEE